MLPLSEGQSQHFHQTGKSEEIFFDEQPFWGIVTNEEVRAPGASSIGVGWEIARQDFADSVANPVAAIIEHLLAQGDRSGDLIGKENKLHFCIPTSRQLVCSSIE